MNKSAQFGIVTLVGLIIVLLFLAPIILKIVNVSVGGFATGISNVSTTASTSVTAIQNTFVTWWDIALMLVFGLNVILLFISAYFIDTNPIFLVLYILVVFLLVVFTPNMIDAVQKVWDVPAFATETGTQLTLTTFLLNNFATILLGLIILSGIVIYAKIRNSGYT